jgi:hypothetical protein
MEINLNSPVSYIHIRDHKDGKDGKKTVVSNGGATIGYVHDGTHVVYTIAKCKYPDVFCRRVGRAITRGRLMSGKDVKVLEVSENTFRGKIRAELLNIYYSTVEQHIPDAHMRLY